MYIHSKKNLLVLKELVRTGTTDIKGYLWPCN